MGTSINGGDDFNLECLLKRVTRISSLQLAGVKQSNFICLWVKKKKKFIGFFICKWIISALEKKKEIVLNFAWVDHP